jgi:hypothetical protein
LVIERFRQNKQPLKTSAIWLAAAAGCIAFDKIYAIFGHDVQSAAMSRMYLYPLLGGALAFLALTLLVLAANRHRFYRLACNIYNSGLAALIGGSLLKGVFDIAGTASVYVPVMLAAGWVMVAAGAVIGVTGLVSRQLVTT